MNKNSQELLTEKPFNIMLKLSLPAILGMIVIGLYPLMDGIFAGDVSHRMTIHRIQPDSKI